MTLERINQNSETLLELLEGCNNLKTQREHIITTIHTRKLPKKLKKNYKKSFKSITGQIELYLNNIIIVTKDIEELTKNGRSN